MRFLANAILAASLGASTAALADQLAQADNAASKPAWEIPTSGGQAPRGSNDVASGVVYYIDYEGGSDAASGLSPPTAWRHLPPWRC